MNGGTLQIGIDNALPAANYVGVAAGATLDLNGHAQTLAFIYSTDYFSNSGSITLGAGGTLTLGDGNDTAFTGPITGGPGSTFNVRNMSISGGQTSVANLNVTALIAGPTVSLLPGSGALGGGSSLQPNLSVAAAQPSMTAAKGPMSTPSTSPAPTTTMEASPSSAAAPAPASSRGPAPSPSPAACSPSPAATPTPAAPPSMAAPSVSRPSPTPAARSNLGPSGTLALAGGTLLFTGASATTSRTVDLNNASGGTVNVSSGGALSFNGPVPGYVATPAGSALAKAGPGGLTLGGSADNAYLVAGVQAGTLTLNKSSSSSVHAVAGISGVAAGATVVVPAAAATRSSTGRASAASTSLAARYNSTCLKPSTALPAPAPLLPAPAPPATSVVAGPAQPLPPPSRPPPPSLSAPAAASGPSPAPSKDGAGPAAKSGLAKVGPGTLTLTGPSTYSGGTTVAAGTLLAGNTAGSATGSGPVVVQSQPPPSPAPAPSPAPPPSRAAATSTRPI